MSIKIGSKVTLLNTHTKAEFIVQIAPTKVESKYRGMGGSYYGAKVDLLNPIDKVDVPIGVVPISSNSPIGKAILGKIESDTVRVKCPNQRIDEYLIMKIENNI